MQILPARKQTQILQRLLDEYQELKSELFQGESFVEPSPADDFKWRRFNQLLAFFHPQFRNDSWVTPFLGGE